MWVQQLWICNSINNWSVCTLESTCKRKGDRMTKITFTFDTGGKSVCGMDNKPDSCLVCSELSNCILDNAYEKLSEIRNKKG